MSGPALLCFDGSEGATEAIRVAAELLRGREALVLSVAIPAGDEVPLDPVSDLVGRFSGLYRDWDEAAGEIAERHADHGAQLAIAAGLQARPLTAVGRPAVTILRIAQECDATVIVLGSGKHTALGGMLGSVSSRVAHQAMRPVLVIPSRRGVNDAD